MIAAPHAGVLGHGHVAGDAAAARRSAGMMRMSRGILDALLVARQAGVVRLLRRGELVPAARSVAVNAVELPAAGAGAHQPARVGVVLAAVAAVGIEIVALERYQVVVIEEAVTGTERCIERCELGVTGSARLVPLAHGEPLHAHQPQVLSGNALAKFAHVTGGGAVARFTIDAGLGPGGAIGVGAGVVVGGHPAHVAAVA